jgi:threonine dehydrogenase-like Zn-dependent dehydrogenase
MCRNGRYTERGIKQVHGFMAERWRIEPEYVVRVDKDLGMLGVLLEPTTVVAKAWQQIAAIGQRTFWDPHTVLVVGAGPIGLLAALAGVHLGREVHVLDRVTTGPKPALVEQLGAVYHAGTGVVPLIVQATDAVAPGGIVCLTGIGSPDTPAASTARLLASDAVLKNVVIFGSVNANRRHYYRAATALARADRSWLEQLITRRVRPDEVNQALARKPDDIKVVMDFAQP